MLVLCSFAVLCLLFGSSGVTATRAQSIYVQRVRVGSSTSYTDTAGHLWSADQPYTPGSYGYTQGAYVYSTTATIANTPDVPLFQQNRHDTAVAYRFDVPNGTYQVRMRFAEIYPNNFGVGKRVFNVSIGGFTVLQNFDMYALVGADAALDETFTSTVADGALTITFSAVVSMPEVNAIEVIATGTAASTLTPTATATSTATPTPTPTASPTPAPAASPTATSTSQTSATPTSAPISTLTPASTPTATATATATATPTATAVAPSTQTPSPTPTVTATPTATVARRIAAGRSTSYTDSLGNVWAADQAYAPGGFGYTSGYAYATTAPISGPSATDPVLYQNNRHNTTFDYKFDVPNGTYAVRLRFAEIYPNDFGVGKRVFNVSVQGAAVLQNFDIYATAGGANIAVDQTFNAAVSSGTLDVAFTSVVSMAEINAIEVVTASSTPDFTLSASPSSQTMGLTSTIQFSATVELTGGFSPSAISMWVTGLPAGISASFAPNPLPHEGTSVLTLTGDGTATVGTYNITLGATAGSISHSQPVTLVVTSQPDFSLSATPLSQDVSAGGPSINYQVAVTAMNNFANTVTLSTSGLPSGAAATFNPNPAAAGQVSVMTVTAASMTSPGTYSVNIVGASGSLNHQISVTLIVSPRAVWSVSSIGTTSAQNNSMRVGPGRNDGVNRLYVGTVNTGRVIEFSWTGSSWSTGVDIGGSPSGTEIHNLGIGPGRNDGINRVYACSLDGNLYELSYAGGTWTQTTVGSPTGYCTHAAVGAGRNDGINRLYATRGLYVFEYTWNGSAWTAVFVGQIATGLAHGISIGPGRGGSTNYLYVATTATGTYEGVFSGGSWSLDPMGDTGDVRNVSPGIGRNDSVWRVYAATQTGEVREFTWNGTSWTYAPLVPAFGFTLVHAYVAAARNDGLNRLYSSGADGSVYEFTYGTSGWTSASLGGGTGYAYGFHLGAGRNDGRLRLYGASFDQLVYEYTFGP